MNFAYYQDNPEALRRALWAAFALLLAAGVAAGAWRAPLERDAKEQLGGDVEIVSPRPAPLKAAAFLSFHSQAVSRVLEARGTAQQGKQEIPVVLKAVDPAYPLYGKLQLAETSRKKPLARLPRQKIWGAAVEQAAHIKVGQRFSVGKAEFMATAAITHEPDGKETNAPRILIGRDALRVTKIVPTTYRYRIRLTEGADAAAWKKRFTETFPEAPWSVATWEEQVPASYMLSLIKALAAATLLALAVLYYKKVRS